MWNTMIRAFVEKHEGTRALSLSTNRCCMDMPRKLFETSLNRDVVTWTAVINGYVKSGQVGVARELFDEMPVKNEVSWSAMITGYAQVGLFKEVLELFNDTQLAGVWLNQAGIVGALSACTFLGVPWIREDCKSWPESACAIELLTRMKDKVKPNEVTSICILNACSRMELVEEGVGRGILEQAKKLVREMPMEPDSYVFGALLNACSVHGDVELGEEMVHGLIQKDMEAKKVKKVIGCSLIEVDGVVCEFIAGDRSHALMEEIVLLSVMAAKHLKSLWFDDDDITTEEVVV
ncbi:Pentatricopeptide repeat-containing protein [Actinidia chinensis var. chinensis]|uniref:Pentatricopeptide repeat-containing protein n=1 Tax=Actinidia chinensis var. chinensis TaxID=1590841 RepID=A0A2R6S2Y2_ACTCC|nr:Pentatricopeptide repeat-containing protein [Actinidia chinensis var. chinensis]